jgi:hypothetical protein
MNYYRIKDTTNRYRLMTQNHYLYLTDKDLFACYLGWLKADLKVKRG